MTTFSPSLQITPLSSHELTTFNLLLIKKKKWLLSPVFQLSYTQWIVSLKNFFYTLNILLFSMNKTLL